MDVRRPRHKDRSGEASALLQASKIRLAAAEYDKARDVGSAAE